MFIAIEGQDYVGKSTQVGLLIKRLTKEGYHVYSTRSPGGCPDAETVREFMLSSTTASSELRNWLAGLSRKLTSKVIHNFLETTPTYNKVAVSDRWISSGYAYQVCGEGVSKEKFTEANQDVMLPDLEIRLLMSDHERQKRKATMPESNRDVMEVAESDPAFAERVRRSFDNSVNHFPVYTISVTHSDSVHDVHEKIWDAVEWNLKRNGK